MTEEDKNQQNESVKKLKRKNNNKNKKIKKPKLEEVETIGSELITKAKWKNKTRVCVFASRGVSYLQRHLMTDLRSLMPHSKPENKMARKETLFAINEICEIKNCSKCLFFEAKKKADLYLWMSSVPEGPSAKFLVENIHTMLELKMTGNCLKGSRPLLSFDKSFEGSPHTQLLKELFVQVFSVPYYHPKSKPFVDRVMSFSLLKNDRVLFRHYQITDENAELVEIGPRMTLNLIKIFKGSFTGETLYHNSHYITPNSVRAALREKDKHKYLDKQASRKVVKANKPDFSVLRNPIDEVFGQ